MRSFPELINVEHTSKLARDILPRSLYDFVAGGAMDERTLRDNLRAFDEVTLLPRAAVATGDVDTSVTVLGDPVSAPVLLAPCGLLGPVHPAAEPGVARAAEQVGTVSMLSTYSSTPLEEVALASAGPKWFELYFLGGRSGAESLIRRAADTGYTALVLTVDTPVPGRRERDVRNGIRYPIEIGPRTAMRFGPQALARPRWLARFARAGFPLGVAHRAPGDVGESMFDTPPTWSDLVWVREHWAGPIAVKGVLTASDARRAVDAGADAVIVSNHGGRQLDGSPATLRVLPEIVAAVPPHTEVFLDGGVRRGGDVVAALALGARAVLIGRPYIWGLAVAGQSGVEKVWRLLVEELVHDLRLLGVPAVSALDRSVLGDTVQWCRSS